MARARTKAWSAATRRYACSRRSWRRSPPEILRRGRQGHRGRSALSQGALSLRGVADVGEHSVLPRRLTRISARRIRRSAEVADGDPQGPRCSHRVAAGHSAERANGTRDAVDGQGLQGTRSGLCRPVCRGPDDVARSQSERDLTRWKPATIASGPAFRTIANGKETILAYQASANDGEPNGNNANYGERLNFPHSGSPFGCCGFHQPSQNLVNFFAYGRGGTSGGVDESPTGTPATPTSRRRSRRRSIRGWTGRLAATACPTRTGDRTAADWIRSPTYGGPYSAKKNVHEKASGAAEQRGLGERRS